MPNNITFSDKLLVLLKQALSQLVHENDAELKDLVEAYHLPSVMHSSEGWLDLEKPEEYVSRLTIRCRDPEQKYSNALLIINAVLEDCTSDTPVVFKERWHFAGTSKATLPGALIPCFRQLEVEGYTVESGQVRAIDSEAPSEAQDKTELAANLRSFPEFDPDVLIYHIDQSDSAAANGEWHAAASEARSLFEGVIVNIARATAESRDDTIPKLPKAGEPRSEFAPSRQYLHSIEFTDASEDKFIAQVFSFASTTGCHPGIPEDETAKLVRRVCWVTARYLVKKYAEQRA